jgi:hypothetical protein
MNNLSITIRLAIIAMAVLILWFCVGVLMPLYFNDLDDSGKFGDGFGAANSLFSAMGIVGITFTIFLQIQNSIEQKKNDRFQLCIKLYDDIKEDLNSIQMGDKKGLFCLSAIIRVFDSHLYETNAEGLAKYFDYLFAVNEQINTLLRIAERAKLENDQLHIIYAKLCNLYFIYLDELYDDILFYEFKDEAFNAFKLSSKAIHEKITSLPLV